MQASAGRRGGTVVRQHVHRIPHHQTELIIAQPVCKLRRENRHPHAAVTVLAERTHDGTLVRTAAVEALLTLRVLEALGESQL